MAETDFKYDVFVSYSSANKEWVRKDLLSALEKAGLKVCIDFRDFKAGKPAIKNMRDSVIESKHTLLVLTEAYLSSGWTDFENMLSQTIDPANRKGRIIPLLKEKCELPLEIGYLTYVNFFDSDDWDIAWKQLFEALGVPTELKPDTSTHDMGSRKDWHLAHPYPMPPNFTGREAEQKMLDDWLGDDKDRLFILCALGGFGKSALAWQWINTHVNPAEWTKLVWWSFYEGDASFEHFIEETLKYLKLDIPQGQRSQVNELLKAMQGQKILLIMDGFERALRAYSSMNAAYQGDDFPLPLGEGQTEGAYDCVNINAEIFLKSVCSLPNIKSKVLMATRLTPHAVKPRGEFMLGCREVELTSMQPADAVEFFYKQKIKGTHAEIEAACEPYGYHPLSLRLLAGRILKDFENPADIVVARKLKIDGDIIQQKHHVLEVSYNSLPPHEQKLLSTIACFRSPVELKTLQSIAENKDILDNDLHDLVERGLLHHTTRQVSNHPVSIFDLHPILRRYTYERLPTLDRTVAHSRLRDYFATVNVPVLTRTLDNLAPLIELYHHTVRAGKLDDAVRLLEQRLVPDPLHFQFGAYQLMIELKQSLFIDGEDKLPRLKDKAAQAWVLNALANSYGMSGQPRRATALYLINAEYDEKQGRKRHLAIGLGNLAHEQLNIGALREAERNLRRQIELCIEIGDNLNESNGHHVLSRVSTYYGNWQKAEQEQVIAQQMFEKEANISGQSLFWSYRALYFLLMARANIQSKISSLKSAIQSGIRALKLADEEVTASTMHALDLLHEDETAWDPISLYVVLDYIRPYWLLGATYRAIGDLSNAEQNLSKAISMCRQINMVDREADILLDLARLRYDQKNYKDAQSLAEEALTITERCGYVLQGADVNLFLAQYALEQEKDKVKAKEYAETALKLATCDGPPYYYKVAYEEAERMLESLK